MFFCEKEIKALRQIEIISFFLFKFVNWIPRERNVKSNANAIEN